MCFCLPCWADAPPPQPLLTLPVSPPAPSLPPPNTRSSWGALLTQESACVVPPPSLPTSPSTPALSSLPLPSVPRPSSPPRKRVIGSVVTEVVVIISCVYSSKRAASVPPYWYLRGQLKVTHTSLYPPPPYPLTPYPLWTLPYSLRITDSSFFFSFFFSSSSSHLMFPV
ncbi:hypothetical protein E2C01_035726 [Portunus trituberculatus]|uniref:Uncharacterized protein n=1 Tax=Portunus trituberculatus TaxID=210409 RepID=A0A5B7F6P3_PORTR|nr:hypothetical protein [Portunus trituberculatus]